jgi:hypothetical protein
MKNLFRKELVLCTNPQVIIFCCLSILVAIPQWPSIIGFVYVLTGFMTIFPRALADQDIQYTVMLPVRKSDVVKGKTLLLIFLQSASLLLSVPFLLLRVLLIDPSMIASAQSSGDESTISYILAVQPSLGMYGYVLLAFGVFNVVLLPWYYRNPQKVNWPPMVATLAAVFVLGLGAAGEAITSMAFQHDRSQVLYWVSEGAVFLAGLLIFALITYFGEKQAEKNFDKVDL